MENSAKWGKIPQAAQHAGISTRTMRRWLENGLIHTRMDTGTILICFANIDKYLTGFKVEKHKNEAIKDTVNKIAMEVGIR